MKISFSPPFIDESVIKEVVDCLKSGWITTGPKVKALEQEIKMICSAKEVLCVNSWTSGAIMMLRWLGVKDGDEVIVPAYTYAATALAVLHAGAIPVMVDTSEDFNISVDAIRSAITSKTKAIIPVDFAGYPCDYASIMSLISEDHILSKFVPTSPVQRKIGRIMVISDAAHSLGANFNYNGHSKSIEPDITIFSLHAVKNITTAEGGAICLNLPYPFDNSELYRLLRQMTLNCQTKDAFTKSKAGGWKYDIIDFGMKINLPDVNAAIGLAQIRKLKTLLQNRKRIFTTYNTAFSRFNWAILPPSIEKGKESSYHIYALRINNITEQQRDDIIDEIATKELAVNVHFIPLPMLSYFKNKGYNILDFPQSYKNYSREISLPLYPQLSDEEVEYVIRTVKNAYEEIVVKKKMVVQI